MVPQEKEMVSESDDDADDKISKSNGYRSPKQFEDVPLN